MYYYPPVPGTAARRNQRIAKAIASRSEISVICTASETSETSEGPGIQMKQVKAWDYRAVLRRKNKDGALPEQQKESYIAQWLIRLINTFPINIMAGEGGLWYLLGLLRRGAKDIREQGITHIYSSFRPFTDHYAAYRLKQKYPYLIWIADFRDLIIDPHYGHIFFAKAHQRFFRKMFSTADVLTTVSDGLAAHLRSYNPHVITLRNGIEDVHQVPTVATSHFTLAYTGSMFLDKRNAEPVFRALQELIQETRLEGSDVRVIYAGKDGHYWKDLARNYRFESLLDDHGIVSPEEAARIQKEVCINILLTISSEALRGVLTGKMIEYFESGSPVLGIIVGENDPELESILGQLEAGKTFSDQPHDLEGIKDFIYQEYLLWRQTGCNRKPLKTEILRRHYSVDAVMQPLYAYLQLDEKT